jgi:hypothetical protein
VTYGSCAGNATVQLYAIDGGGHVWPRSGSSAVDASSVIAAFFQAHPRAAYWSHDSDNDSIPDIHDMDNDNDGCPDERELGSDSSLGGDRSPKNPYDYFNPSHDNHNRLDDILIVLGQYFQDKYVGQPPVANPRYRPDTDRTYLGGVPWNLGPGDGLQRMDDLRLIIKQYLHDCA